ncbi:hypothetical protein D3093_13090 [Azospirillum argentinense]|uniref:Uncharacterized protein n=1 Tax=Azospirillum argentinense TaxID=2970906 RepID=A0A4D8PKR0_9PROT|nr:hypothetical protein D3093_13090 [Azospirillum argentinense]
MAASPWRFLPHPHKCTDQNSTTVLGGRLPAVSADIVAHASRNPPGRLSLRSKLSVGFRHPSQAQATEAAITAAVLNRMLDLRRANSVRVASAVMPVAIITRLRQERQQSLQDFVAL